MYKVFHKVLNISFNYELKVPQILKQNIVKGIVVDGHLLGDIKEDCKICDNLYSKQL